MADVAECEAALADLRARLEAVNPDVRRKHAVDRTISLRVTDLDTIWCGRLQDGLLEYLRHEDGQRAQIRVSASSDDLVALLEGTLNLAQAWASGRVKVDASPLDLLRLRGLF